MLIDVDLGHKGPSNLPMVTREHAFMLNGELDIGNRPANIPPITKANMVYC